MMEFKPVLTLALRVLNPETAKDKKNVPDVIIAYRFDNNEVVFVENEMFNSIESLVTLIESNGILLELLLKRAAGEYEKLDFDNDSLTYLCFRDFAYDVLANSSHAQTANEVVKRYGIPASIRTETLRDRNISNTIWVQDDPWSLAGPYEL